MKCQLCQNERPLIEAHIIPKSFFRIDPKERQVGRLVTNVEGRYSQKIRKGVYDENIVCLDCERKFTAWDDYACELFIKKWESFEPINNRGTQDGFRLAAYDYTLLKMFFISLLWRAAASRHPMFEKVNVGPHLEKLRDAILQGTPGDFNFYGVALQAFDSSNVGMLDPHSERFENVRFYRFYLSQIIALVKVDVQPMPRELEAITVKPDQPLQLVLKQFIGSNERTIMKNLVINDRKKARQNR